MVGRPTTYNLPLGKVPFPPSSKHMTHYSICPKNDMILMHFKIFLKNVDAMYECCGLGTHQASSLAQRNETFEDGVLLVPAPSFRAAPSGTSNSYPPTWSVFSPFNAKLFGTNESLQHSKWRRMEQ